MRSVLFNDIRNMLNDRPIRHLASYGANAQLLMSNERMSIIIQDLRFVINKTLTDGLYK